MPRPGDASSTAKSSKRPWPTEVFNQLQRRAHERRADWIRRARRNRSGLNGHEDFEHSPDSICMPRRSPSLLRAHERRADWILRARRNRSGLNGHEDFEHSPDSICMPRRSPSLLRAHERRADWIGERAETGVALMAMRISSTAAIQYVRRAEAHHQRAKLRSRPCLVLARSTAKSSKRPWPTEVFNQLQVRAHERRADWIRRARRNRSGLNGHEDFEHSPDSICMPRRSPSPKGRIVGSSGLAPPLYEGFPTPG